MIRSARQWKRWTRHALLLGLAYAATGCATPARRQAYIVLDRYFSEHEADRNTQPPDAILKIERKAADAERIMAEQRLKALQKSQKKQPDHISTIERLLAECDSDLVGDASKAALAAETDALLPKETSVDLRRRISAWSDEQWPVVVSEWRRHPEAIRFRDELQRQKARMSARFQEGLEQARRLAKEGSFAEAIKRMAFAASFEPDGAPLIETAAAVLDDFSADMEMRAETGRYWSLYSVSTNLLEYCESPSETQGAETLRQTVAAKVAQTLDAYSREIVEHLTDQAEKHSTLWGRHGLAVALCDTAATLTILSPSGEVASLRHRADAWRKNLERIRAIYAARAIESMRRPVWIDPIQSNPQDREEAALLRTRLERAIRQALKTLPSGNAWGVAVEPLADGKSRDAEKAAGGYIVGDGVLDTVVASGPDLTEEHRARHETVFEPETVYGVRRQKSVTHHVTRKTFRQEAKLRGRIAMRYGDAEDIVSWDQGDTHAFVVDREDNAKQETRFLQVPPVRKATAYTPAEEQPINLKEVLSQLRDKIAMDIAKRLMAWIEKYPDALERQALEHERLQRWDDAAHGWALLGEYERQRREQATPGSDRDSLLRTEPKGKTARERSIHAAIQWLMAQEAKK